MDKAYIREKKKCAKSGLAVSLAKGTLVALLCGAAAVLIFCAVAMKFDDPDKTSPIFGVAAMLITAFAGGFATAKFHRERGLWCGALFGLIMVLIIALVSLITKQKITTSVFAILAPAAVVIAALGGIAGVGGKKPRRRKKNKF